MKKLIPRLVPKIDGGPAFPTPKSGEWGFNSKNEEVFAHDVTSGMSLRDWFAGQALAGVISGSAQPIFSDHGINEGLVKESIQSAIIDGPGKLDENSNSIRTIWAWTAYCVADAMLKQREKQEEE
jgi:hypothetical protein